MNASLTRFCKEVRSLKDRSMRPNSTELNIPSLEFKNLITDQQVHAETPGMKLNVLTKTHLLYNYDSHTSAVPGHTQAVPTSHVAP